MEALFGLLENLSIQIWLDMPALSKPATANLAATTSTSLRSLRDDANRTSLKFVDLSDYDDILSDLLLDSVFLGFRTHKMNAEYYNLQYSDDNSITPRKRQALCSINWKDLNRDLMPSLVLELIQRWIIETQSLKKASEELLLHLLGQRTLETFAR
jgi:hypothetical protein